MEDWPSWNLPVHALGHAQTRWSGSRTAVSVSPSARDELPNYVIPAFQSIGSNELIVDVPLGAADFHCGAEFASRPS